MTEPLDKDSFKNDVQGIIDALRACVSDAEKMDSGNVSAGKRLRKQAQETVHLLKSLRQSVQDKRNELTATRKDSRTSKSL